MPRTRLFWQLFIGWCAAVAATLAAGFWIASVQFAGLADEALAARVTDAVRGVVAAFPGGDPLADRKGFLNAAAALERSSGIRCTLAADDTAAVGPAGRSRYDITTGRRSLEVAVPVSAGVVLAEADAADSDETLARWQRRLLAGCAMVAACAAALGSAVVWRVTRPVDDLVATAERLVAGDTAAAVPATEVAEFAALASALVRLREQLVERGLTIGRQGTQQEAVLGSMIEGVLSVDARQRLLGVNHAAAELLDIDAMHAAGRPLQDVIRNPDLRRFALAAIDCREPVEDDLVLHGLRDRTIRMRGTALRDASGAGGAVIVLNDVTEMQRLERMRRDFVANVSHELKTPIASIKGFVETLLDGALDEPDDARRFLGIVGRQADRLAAIIEDLLALSRIEQSEGTGKLPRDDARVADVLQAAVGDCQHRAADRHVALAVTCPDDLAWRVNAPLLEQAVINLVDNAIKYSDPGGTVRIEASAEPGPGGDLVIRVIDDGCGIEAEHLPRLFERFYRVDKARSRGLGGTGLGLSIVKHIVQAHAGGISVESEPGRGTSFTVRMPPA